ncbi:MAG: aminotransferase class I/II-fold pyridoxal phosphate-dependent enzyme [Flavonifractor plautii]
MGEICNEYGVMVVADEIHHDLIQPGYKHIVYASLGKEFADNCVICTSLSKTFNLAGLCYASIIIPNDEVRAKFQKQMGLQAFMHIERFGPVAHEAAYRHGAEWLEELIQVIKGNYEYVRDFFAQHFPGVVVTELEGTYLVWCDFRSLRHERRRHEGVPHRRVHALPGQRHRLRRGRFRLPAHQRRLPPQDPGRRSGPLLSGRQEARHGPVISLETRPEWIRRL